MADSRFRALAWWVRTISIAVMFTAFITIVWTVGPWLETRFNPVSQKLIMSEIVPGPNPGTVQFTAEFVKMRNCEYVGLGWYHKSADGEVERVPVATLRTVRDTDASPTRPVGYTKTGPWIVSLTQSQLLNASYAILYSKCHPFWLTETNFWP